MNKLLMNLAGEQVTEIEKFSHDGRGIARINGKTTFIQGALPTEEVRFRYTKIKPDFDEAKVVAILRPSPERVKAACPHYELCGGCSLQHLATHAQIHTKQMLLLEQLQRIGRCTPQVILPVIAGPSWHYRSKARFSVRYVGKKKSTLIGFREKNNPSFITNIDTCPIMDSRIDKEIAHLKQLLSSFSDPASIAQVEVAAGDGEVALIFRNLKPLSASDADKLRDFGLRTDFRLFLQPNSSQPNRPLLFYPQDSSEFLTYTIQKYNIKIKFYPSDFTQINMDLNQLLIAQVMDLMALTDEDVVLDLFCGLGNFSLPMAKYCKQVIGVEGSRDMVATATMNAAANNLNNVAFSHINLERREAIAILPQLVGNKFSKILLDPPRSGASMVVKYIHQLQPKLIVYVSCNPATLARDAYTLTHEHGYSFKAIAALDLFPHTAHVEAIALFESTG